ncbi:lytic transglycosylase domain-containing protein [Amantichitinum ursilacus]|uniref:Soluble lytic murein transglycosylase n=1 Tax=Amantichitinum ursilacus TaxID=857265 RepID=A0A0N0GPT1_9NEIS|nr:lytic transglycosylase domain-containing protein [Amantichitinum ursilacus]KPC54022.1 Soluble lytic murein transglycosylase precursor [Amantichitinum ursilacus]
MKQLKQLSLFALLALSAATAHARIDLTALRDAARSRDVVAIQRMADDARGEPLEMYPRYYLISTQITQISPDDVNAFFERFDGSPLADRLRQEWLRELGKRQDWARYLPEYAKVDGPSVELQCLAAQAQMATSGNANLRALRSAWFTDKGQADSCAPVFEAMFNAGVLNQDDAWARIRLALAANRPAFATQLAPRVGFPAELTGRNLGLAANQPAKVLPKLSMSSRAGREVALFIVNRTARSDPDRAAALLSELNGLPAADARYGWQQIAGIAARKQHPQASAWYARGGQDGLDANGRSWSVRAALRADDVRTVLDRINAMPPEQADDSAWVYWKAEALKRLNRPTEAAPLLAKLSAGDDFYALLAREETGPTLEADPAPYRPTEDDVRTVNDRAGVQRALALFEQNWRLEGIREWNAAMRPLTPQQLVAAATLADRKRLYDRSIYAAERAKAWSPLGLKYPTPYRSAVEREARQQGLDPAWVYGLIRQESRFVADIRSPVGATGLMQLMPSTAQWVARKNGQKKLDVSTLTDADTNVAMGAFYLRYITDRLSGQAILATAGYNAGPGRAKAWQEDRALDPVIYIETIPFDETRDYVKKVMTNAQYYGATFGEQTPFHQRLQPVPSKNAAPPVSADVPAADAATDNGADQPASAAEPAANQ